MKNEDETVYPIILNSSCLVSGTSNVYRYSFPQGSVKFQDSKICLSSIAIYYSWFNISVVNNNNSFQFLYPTGITYTVTIPTGFYSIVDLNSYLQQYLISNGLYLVDSSGKNVYYLEFITNSSFYAVQFNAYPIPTSLPVGWTNPGGMVFPASAWTPKLIILPNAFRSTIGFVTGSYPSVDTLTNYSMLSSVTPQVSTVQSVIVGCSLLNNRYSNPSTILYSFTPNGVEFGSLIQSSPTQYSFIDIQDGNYSSFDVIFYDQSFNALQINDTNLVIQFFVKSNRKGVSF